MLHTRRAVFVLATLSLIAACTIEINSGAEKSSDITSSLPPSSDPSAVKPWEHLTDPERRHVELLSGLQIPFGDADRAVADGRAICRTLFLNTDDATTEMDLVTAVGNPHEKRDLGLRLLAAERILCHDQFESKRSEYSQTLALGGYTRVPLDAVISAGKEICTEARSGLMTYHEMVDQLTDTFEYPDDEAEFTVKAAFVAYCPEAAQR